MSYEMDAYRGVSSLFPPSVDDYVGKDDPVRYLDAFVNALDLQGLGFEEQDEPVPTIPESREGLKFRAHAGGRPWYGSSLLLKIWLYGYFSGVSSCRKLERLCGDSVSMMWLAGRLEPDHNTLWRFWNRNHEAIAGVFFMTVKVAERAGLVGFDLHGIDGTKMQARGSTRKALKKGQHQARKQRIAERIEQIEAEIRAARENDDQEQIETLTNKRLPLEKLQAAIDEFLPEALEEVRQNVSEPEARVMQGGKLGYNAQAVVDAQAGIIVSTKVVSDQNDERQLIPMLDQVHQTYGRVADETVADGGYNTADALAQCEDKSYPVILSASPHDAEANDNPYHVTRFAYDKQTDTWICPQGKSLTYERISRRKRSKYESRVYRGRKCSACPVRELCTKDPRGRSLEMHPHHEVVMRQRDKRGLPDKRKLLAQRFSFGERPFAVIKHQLGFRRFRFRGIAKGGVEFAFVCAVANLITLFNHGIAP